MGKSLRQIRLITCVHELVPMVARILSKRHGLRSAPTDAELEAIRRQTLTHLFRTLLLFQAKRRGLLPADRALLDAPIAEAIVNRLPDCDLSDTRQLGSLYESLLGYRLKIVNHEPQLAHDPFGRKATGSFYTPDHIVRYIVQHTIGPVLSRKLESMTSDADPFEKIFDFKIIDPAMGSGHFLVESTNFITAELHRFLVAHGRPVEPRLIKRLVLERCIYGIDSDPQAAELARMSLWLDASDSELPMDCMNAHLRVGDSLAGSLDHAVDTFDAVLCNPPYSGHKGDFDSRQLVKRFPVCRRYPNPATAFCELVTRLCKTAGAFGLIIPKSIQYVEAWQDARELLTERYALDQLLDASEAFEDVLLEQTILLGRKGPPRDVYLAGTLLPTGQSNVRVFPRKRIDALPAIVEPESLRLFDHIAHLGPRLGDISRTSQALGYQAKLNQGESAQAIPIYRGRQIRPMYIDPPVDRIDRAHLLNADGQYTSKVAAMLQPKVVSQNIIAHLTRPRPRIWIIAAPDPAGILCLNTISTTILSDDRFPIEYIAAILNSTLANWFYNEFVFCRAVRTMHFDHYYAGKLPIAVPTAATVQDCRALAGRCAAARLSSPKSAESRAHRQRLIDDIVFRAYHLSELQQSFVWRYCYGPADPITLSEMLPSRRRKPRSSVRTATKTWTSASG